MNTITLTASGARPLGILLYDGDCRFCSKASRTMKRLSGNALELRSFRDDGVLAQFPQVRPDRCEKAMQLVMPNGRVYEGAEAAVQALQRRWFGKPALVYYVPGLRQLVDAIYASIARYRFRIAGRQCEGGTCHLHVR